MHNIVNQLYFNKKKKQSDFLGSPEVKTPYFYCSGHRFDPWGTKIPYAVLCGKEKNRKKSKTVLGPEILKKVGGKGDGVRGLAQWQSCPSVYLKKHQRTEHAGRWDQGPENG